MKKRNIPLLDLKPEYRVIRKDVEKNLNRCFTSQHWILGEEVLRLERAIARYLGINHACAVASGTDALTVSLRALALKRKKKQWFDKKDEIITTPFTFIATAESIVYAGATPVFVDIDPVTYNIDPAQIEKAVTPHTVGIIPVHLYGLPCDMKSIMRIARKRNLFVLEDTAQAFGAQCYKNKAGTIGHAGTFSFFPSKNLGAYGDGGLIATDDRRLAETVRILRNHGQTGSYRARWIGYNSRLDSIQAAVLLAKVKHINSFNAKRRRIAQKYNDALGGIRHIEIPRCPEGSKHVYHLYTIQVKENRDRLLAYLNRRGIAARVYYPKLLSQMEAFDGYSRRQKTPQALRLLSHVISLPLYPGMNGSQIKYVTANIKNFFRKETGRI